MKKPNTIVWSPELRSLLGAAMDPTTERFSDGLHEFLELSEMPDPGDELDDDGESLAVVHRKVPFETDEQKAKFWEEWRASLGPWFDIYGQEEVASAIEDITIGGYFYLGTLALINPALGQEETAENFFETSLWRWMGSEIDDIDEWISWRVYLLHNPSAIANVLRYANAIFSQTLGLDAGKFADHLAALPPKMRRFDLHPNAWTLALRKVGAEGIARQLEDALYETWQPDRSIRGWRTKKDFQENYLSFLRAVHASPPEVMTEYQYAQRHVDYSKVSPLLEQIYSLAYQESFNTFSAMALVLHLMQQICEILGAPPFRSMYQQVLLSLLGGGWGR